MQTPIKQVDPMATYLELREEIDAAMKSVMDSGWYVLGGQVADFEREMASSLAVEHCLGVGSGTDALQLALRTAGIGPGDLVLAPSHTAVATVAAVELAGAEALLVDVEPRSFTLDAEKLAATVASHGSGGRLKAVIAVHLYGHPADLAAVAAICDEAGLFLIEDCAQAQGAAIGDRAVGSFGDFAAFSFYPTKNLGAFGDGGALVVRDEQLARRAGELRQYGWRERFVSAEPGMNTRLDELQAALLRVKLRALPGHNARRREIAAFYNEHLAGSAVATPAVAAGVVHAYHQYVVRCPQREAVMAALDDANIGYALHYPLPVHQQPAYADRLVHGEGGLDCTDALSGEILSLPMYPQLDEEQLHRVCQVLNTCAGKAVS
jgi:dTDP-4-amino-4,6-dideoxygalactose transaminase